MVPHRRAAYRALNAGVKPDETRPKAMTSYERAQFFDTICAMRDAYAVRGDDDRRSALSIDDAVIYADAVITAIAAESIIVVVDAPDAIEEPAPTGDPRD
jgi:hypothetical protein